MKALQGVCEIQVSADVFYWLTGINIDSARGGMADAQARGACAERHPSSSLGGRKTPSPEPFPIFDREPIFMVGDE